MSPRLSQACPGAVSYHQEPPQPRPKYYPTSPYILESSSLNIVVRQDTDDQKASNTHMEEPFSESSQNRVKLQKSPQYVYAAPDPLILSDFRSNEPHSGDFGSYYG